MKWTPEHVASALREGWGVFEVIEHDDPKKVVMQVMQVHDRFPSHYDAQVHVVTNARAGSKLHLAALATVVASRVPPKRAKKR